MMRLWVIAALVGMTCCFRVTHKSDCGKSRGCWMLPAGCAEQCSVLVTWKHEGRGVVIEMESSLPVDAPLHGSWLAFAISRDSQMGNDTVLECHFPPSGFGSVHLSHNTQKDNILLTKASAVLIKDAYAETMNGRGLCGAEWLLDHTVVDSTEKDLILSINSGKYILMITQGLLEKDGSKRPHEMTGVGAPWISGDRVRFCHKCPSAFHVVDEHIAKAKVL